METVLILLLIFSVFTYPKWSWKVWCDEGELKAKKYGKFTYRKNSDPT